MFYNTVVASSPMRSSGRISAFPMPASMSRQLALPSSVGPAPHHPPPPYLYHLHHNTHSYHHYQSHSLPPPFHTLAHLHPRGSSASAGHVPSQRALLGSGQHQQQHRGSTSSAATTPQHHHHGHHGHPGQQQHHHHHGSHQRLPQQHPQTPVIAPLPCSTPQQQQQQHPAATDVMVNVPTAFTPLQVLCAVCCLRSNKQDDATFSHPVSKTTAAQPEVIRTAPHSYRTEEPLTRPTSLLSSALDLRKMSSKKKPPIGNTLRSPAVKRSAQSPVAMKGWLYKQGSEGLMLWKKRWFVLSDFCLFYYKGPDEDKTLGSILLPSYKISQCTSDDRIYRRFAFKAEHLNMRTYYFATETKMEMHQWMNAMSLASILQNTGGGAVSSSGSHLDSPESRPNEQMTVTSMRGGGGGHLEDEDSGFTSYHSRRPPGSSPQQQDANSTLTGSYTSNEAYRSGNQRDSLSDDYLSSGDKYPSNYAVQQQQQQQSGIYQATTPVGLHGSGNKQHLYANAPPKPKRLGGPGESVYGVVTSRGSNGGEDVMTPTRYADYLEQERLQGRLAGTHQPKSRRSDDYRGPVSSQRRTPDPYARTATVVPGYDVTPTRHDAAGVGQYTDEYAATIAAVAGQMQAAQSHEEYLIARRQITVYPVVRSQKAALMAAAASGRPRPGSADVLDVSYDAAYGVDAARHRELLQRRPRGSDATAVAIPPRPKSSVDQRYGMPEYDGELLEGGGETARRSLGYHPQVTNRDIHKLQEPSLSSPSSGKGANHNMSFDSYLASGGGGYGGNSPYAGTPTTLPPYQHQSDTQSYRVPPVANHHHGHRQERGQPSNSASSNSLNAMLARHSIHGGTSGATTPTINSRMVESGSCTLPRDRSFLRSASARLPSATSMTMMAQHQQRFEGGDDVRVKTQQREESMKRLLEWKQRMLQSPLSKKYASPGESAHARSQSPAVRKYSVNGSADLSAASLSRSQSPSVGVHRQLQEALSMQQSLHQQPKGATVGYVVGRLTPTEDYRQQLPPELIGYEPSRRSSSKPSTPSTRPQPELGGRRDYDTGSWSKYDQPRHADSREAIDNAAGNMLEGNAKTSPSPSRTQEYRQSTTLNRYYNSYSSDDEDTTSLREVRRVRPQGTQASGTTTTATATTTVNSSSRASQDVTDRTAATTTPINDKKRTPDYVNINTFESGGGGGGQQQGSELGLPPPPDCPEYVNLTTHSRCDAAPPITSSGNRRRHFSAPDYSRRETSDEDDSEEDDVDDPASGNPDSRMYTDNYGVAEYDRRDVRHGQVCQLRQQAPAGRGEEPLQDEWRVHARIQPIRGVMATVVKSANRVDVVSSTTLADKSVAKSDEENTEVGLTEVTGDTCVTWKPCSSYGDDSRRGARKSAPPFDLAAPADDRRHSAPANKGSGTGRAVREESPPKNIVQDRIKIFEVQPEMRTSGQSEEFISDVPPALPLASPPTLPSSERASFRRRFHSDTETFAYRSSSPSGTSESSDDNDAGSYGRSAAPVRQKHPDDCSDSKMNRWTRKCDQLSRGLTGTLVTATSGIFSPGAECHNSEPEEYYLPMNGSTGFGNSSSLSKSTSSVALSCTATCVQQPTVGTSPTATRHSWLLQGVEPEEAVYVQMDGASAFVPSNTATTATTSKSSANVVSPIEESSSDRQESDSRSSVTRSCFRPGEPEQRHSTSSSTAHEVAETIERSRFPMAVDNFGYYEIAEKPDEVAATKPTGGVTTFTGSQDYEPIYAELGASLGPPLPRRLSTEECQRTSPLLPQRNDVFRVPQLTSSKLSTRQSKKAATAATVVHQFIDFSVDGAGDLVSSGRLTVPSSLRRGELAPPGSSGASDADDEASRDSGTRRKCFTLSDSFRPASYYLKKTPNSERTRLQMARNVDPGDRPPVERPSSEDELELPPPVPTTAPPILPFARPKSCLPPSSAGQRGPMNPSGRRSVPPSVGRSRSGYDHAGAPYDSDSTPPTSPLHSKLNYSYFRVYEDDRRMFKPVPAEPGTGASRSACSSPTGTGSHPPLSLPSTPSASSNTAGTTGQRMNLSVRKIRIYDETKSSSHNSVPSDEDGSHFASPISVSLAIEGRETPSDPSSRLDRATREWLPPVTRFDDGSPSGTANPMEDPETSSSLERPADASPPGGVLHVVSVANVKRLPGSAPYYYSDLLRGDDPCRAGAGMESGSLFTSEQQLAPSQQQSARRRHIQLNNSRSVGGAAHEIGRKVNNIELAQHRGLRADMSRSLSALATTTGASSAATTLPTNELTDSIVYLEAKRKLAGAERNTYESDTLKKSVQQGGRCAESRALLALAGVDLRNLYPAGIASEKLSPLPTSCAIRHVLSQPHRLSRSLEGLLDEPNDDVPETQPPIERRSIRDAGRSASHGSHLDRGHDHYPSQSLEPSGSVSAIADESLPIHRRQSSVIDDRPSVSYGADGLSGAVDRRPRFQIDRGRPNPASVAPPVNGGVVSHRTTSGDFRFDYDVDKSRSSRFDNFRSPWEADAVRVPGDGNDDSDETTKRDSSRMGQQNENGLPGVQHHLSGHTTTRDHHFLEEGLGGAATCSRPGSSGTADAPNPSLAFTNIQQLHPLDESEDAHLYCNVEPRRADEAVSTPDICIGHLDERRAIPNHHHSHLEAAPTCSQSEFIDQSESWSGSVRNQKDNSSLRMPPRLPNKRKQHRNDLASPAPAPSAGPLMTVREDANMTDSDIQAEMKLHNAKLREYLSESEDTEHCAKLGISAGDLLGKTHEELVLLLIHLRRDQAKLEQGMHKIRLELEAEQKLMQFETTNKNEHLGRQKQLVKHYEELGKQYDMTKPLINLVDNMVKLGSLYGGSEQMLATQYNLEQLPPQEYASPKKMIEFSRRLQERRLLQHERPEWSHATADQLDLQTKLQELCKLDKAVHEESWVVSGLQQDQDLLERAVDSLKIKVESCRDSPMELEKLQKQLKAAEKELTKIRSQFSRGTKKLEETAADNAKIEGEIVQLRQKMQASIKQNLGSGNSNEVSHVKVQLEKELSRISNVMEDLAWKREELSGALEQLKDRNKALLAEVRASPTGVAGSIPLPNRKNHRSTYLETDLDTMETQDIIESWKCVDSGGSTSTAQGVAGRIPLYVNTYDGSTSGQGSNGSGREGTTSGTSNTTTIKVTQEEDEEDVDSSLDYGHSLESTTVTSGMDVNDPYAPHDISEADDKMKRYYGIIPREKPAEIRTVRIVKRESERRNKAGRERRRVTYGDDDDEDGDATGASGASLLGDELDDELAAGAPFVDTSQLTEDMLNFQRSMSLPRNYGRTGPPYRGPYVPPVDSGNLAIPVSAGHTPGSDQPSPDSAAAAAKSSQSYYYRTPSLSSANSETNLSAHERLFGSSSYGLTTTSTMSTSYSNAVSQMPAAASPTLSTPAFKSEAARKIVAETAHELASVSLGGDVGAPGGRGEYRIAGTLRRRQKRRHYTISSSQPLVLETINQKMIHARSRDDLDIERCLRVANTPDVVKSTIKKNENFDESTIDRELGLPQKIVIPERYVEEENEQLTPAEQLHRLQKAESIRKMLSETSTFGDVHREEEVESHSTTLKKKYEADRRQRDHLLALNQIIAKEVMERSKAVAASTSSDRSPQ